MKVKERGGGGGGGCMQIENLPLFCLANHNMFTHTVITMSKWLLFSKLSYYVCI